VLRALSKFFRGMREEGYERKNILVLDVVKMEC
jgi:hypothetical protein